MFIIYFMEAQNTKSAEIAKFFWANRNLKYLRELVFMKKGLIMFQSRRDCILVVQSSATNNDPEGVERFVIN